MTSLSDHGKPPAPRSTGTFDPAKTGAKLPEAEFLRQEADRARTAIANTWAEAKANLARGVDPRVWTAEHPWIALASATVAGFFAAYALVPSKEEQALKKLAKIEQALSGGYPPYAAPPANGQPDGKAQSSGILGTWGSEIMKLVRPAVASALSAAISAKTVQEDNTGNDNTDATASGAGTASGTAAGLDPSINPDMR
jgi:hypothetical protein